jgi:hypothetical protein
MRRIDICLCLAACCILGTGERAESADPNVGGTTGRLSDKAAMSFDYFTNSWNVIALKDYRHGARVTPANEILLSGRRGRSQSMKYGSRLRLRFGGQLTPLSRRQIKTLLDGWMPVILLSDTDGKVRYDFMLWATPLPTVKDWKKAFDWPTEGENFLIWITVKATNTGPAAADAKVQLEQIGPSPPIHPALSWKLAPGRSAQGVWRVPFDAVKDASAWAKADPDLWLKRTVGYWRGVMAAASHIEVPCRKATEALLAAHVCQLIANDRGEVHGGEGFYDVFYIRDGAYQVLELAEAGLTGAARKALGPYLKRQRPDGRFESQRGQFDANGQAVWLLWHYYKITGDRAFLAKAYPQMLRAVRWTMQARRKARPKTPFAGVLPNAPADGECLWNGKYHIVGYDLWNLRGMLCTADAAAILGRKDEATELTTEAKAYRAAIDAAWKRTGLKHFPPSWEKAGTHWGNTETLWPTELFERDDSRVTALSRHVREEFAGGFIEGTIQWKGTGKVNAIHPYMGAYTTMTDLVRGRSEQVVEDFYWYLLHATASHAFPEGIYYKRRFAWSNTIPHVTGACNYAIMLRHMLVHEAGDELHLLRAVPDWWLGRSRSIRIERLPTWFGTMGLTIRGTPEGVKVTFDRPRRQAPKRVVLHLPKSRPLIGSLDGVDVIVRPQQKKRWDFPTVVSLYKGMQPKPNAPSLTTGKPATCSFALGPHLARLANDGHSDSTTAYWATDVTKQKGKHAWWQVDLQKPTTVGRVVVVAYYGDKRFYGFTVETSPDGKTWQMAADRRDNKTLSTAKGYTCRFAPRKVRYLRVAQTHNSANTGRHLVEVMAFEK